MDDTIARLRLHLLRHAHAGDPEAWSGDDALRPLTRKGRRQCELLGAFLDAHGVRPDVIVSEPQGARARRPPSSSRRRWA